MRKKNGHLKCGSTLAFVGFLLAAITFGSALAAEKESRFSAENESGQAKVRVRYQEGKVLVNVIDRKKIGLPNSIQISLFEKDGKRTDLELSATGILPPKGESTFNRDYRGVLPASQNSFVGVSLKIPFSKTTAPPTRLEVGVPPVSIR